MLILEPSALPLELLERFIDETFHSQLSTGTRSEKIIDTQTLSSLARVSHSFRQRVNAHRFSTISFHRSDLSLHYIHAFCDLLRSDVWAAPSAGLARHVRKLVLILGEKDGQGDIVPYRAIDDGSFTTIMNAVFRGSDGDPSATNDYTLALWGYTECPNDILIHDPDWLNWSALDPDFSANIERLLDSCISRLELTWLGVVSPTVLKRRHVKHLYMSCVSIRLTPQHMEDFDALGPWNHLESLDIHNAHVFDLMDPETVPMLKTLTVSILDNATADSLSDRWQHWTMLEDLTLNIDNEHIFPSFRVDYRNLSNLKRLTIDVRLTDYKTVPSPVESLTNQILNILGPHLPPLSRIEIVINSTFHAFSRYQDVGLINDIPTMIDCASLDAVLAQHSLSMISTMTLWFGIWLSRGVGDDLQLERFRQDGLAVLREAFPRLTTGPRRRVYDSVVSKAGQDQERANALLHEGSFSVEYTEATRR
ncbi:hypothetical protein BJ912DRAFT_1144521 [Pholiota molesta]|nr:hypothetical protein BJ912DRAFT_1144521 [Pholiota molesta]